MIPRRSSAAGRAPLRSRGAAALLLAGLLAAAAAPAQEAAGGPPRDGPPARVALEIGVHHVSQRPGPVDPAAEALVQKLREDFRYQSVRVLDRRRLDLALGETGTVDLPSGRRLKVKPRRIGENGLFMRVEIEGRLRTSLQVPNHHQVVIGAERHEEGKLVVTLEPDY